MMYIYILLTSYNNIDDSKVRELSENFNKKLLNDILRSNCIDSVTYVNFADYTQFTIMSTKEFNDEDLDTIMDECKKYDNKFFNSPTLGLDDVVNL